MEALPLTRVHVRLGFADLPELHAEAEVYVSSRVLRPTGYMPLTGEHIWMMTPQSRGVPAQGLGQHPQAAPLPVVGRPEWPGMHAALGSQHRKGQDLLSPLHQVVLVAFSPNRELTLPASFNALGYTTK